MKVNFIESYHIQLSLYLDIPYTCSVKLSEAIDRHGHLPNIVKYKVLSSFGSRVENVVPQEPHNLCDVELEYQYREDEAKFLF